MLNFIDVSSWQGDINPAVMAGVDAAIVKATQGTDYVNPYCDPVVQRMRAAGKPWGFYHFAEGGSPSDEAAFFVENCANYFGEGVPVLDFEADAVQEWGAQGANAFALRVHELTGVWPWVYMSQSVSVQYDWHALTDKCGLWVAAYPPVTSPTFKWARENVPAIGDTGSFTVAAWQFCSDGRHAAYNGDLDFNIAFVDSAGWAAYARGDRDSQTPETHKSVEIVENDEMRVTIERKQ